MSRYRTIFSLGLILAFVAFSPTQAQQQQDDTLSPFSSVIGNPAPGETQDWTFTAVDGEVVSLLVESEDGFDPVLSLISETGAVLLTNDDYDYPNTQNAVMQAITIPFTGTFTARVSGYGDSSGSYTLTRLRGFADGFKLNGFSPDGTWETANDDLEVEQANNALNLTLAGNDVYGLAIDTSLERLTDFYTQARVNINEGDPGWVVHMTARQASENSAYQISISDQGLWRLRLLDSGAETVLRDWVTHPAIRPGETNFNLGVLANGTAIEVFYNGSPLGHFLDSTLTGGVIGFGVETAPGLNSEVDVTFEDFFITTPLTTADSQNPSLMQFIIQDPSLTALGLERRREIPTGGELVMNVPQSSVQAAAPGVSRIALGRGSTYENFVMGSDVAITTAGGGPAGCGIYMRATGDTNYALAYLDNTGSYGLAQRQGEVFLPGVFGQDESLREGIQQLLVIATGDVMQLFVNGRYMGEIESPAAVGEVGNAAVNFEATTTTCSFENTWLWQW